MNPDSLEVRYYEVPDNRTRIRRLDLDSTGMAVGFSEQAAATRLGW